MLGHLYLLWFCAIVNVTCFLDTDLIIHYSRSKNVGHGTIFSCKSRKGKFVILKELMEYNLQFLFVNVNDAIGKLQTLLHRDHYHLGVVLDGDCANVTDFLNESCDKKYFYETYHWLITSTSEETALTTLSGVKLNINSDVHLAVPTENETYNIYDVYNPASEHGGKLMVKNIGYYKKLGEYKARLKGNKYWERKNMTGVTFKTAVVIPSLDKPLSEYLASDENKQINSMHRFQVVCVSHCKDFFNFSLDIQRTDSWGYLQEDGHFDGLVGLLERRLVDFGSSPLIYKLDRMPVVDYGYGNWILRSTFIYRRPKPTPRSDEIFLKPLAKWVWISISGVMIVVLVVLKIVFTNELSVRHKTSDRIDSSWSFLVLFTLGAFCQQGATCYPKLFSSRILSVFVYLFCILIYQFYSASIVSFLLMDPPRTINNLKDLTDSQLRVGIEDILIDRNYFVQTTDPNAIELYKKKIEGPSNDSGFYNPSYGLELVRNGGFAFHVETSTAYPIIEETFSNELICELEEIQMYRTQPMHTNLQKNSPFREMLNYCMFKMAENGNLHRLRKYWDARKPSCIAAAKKVKIHVSLNEFSCGLVALSCGVCLSLVFLFMEIVYYHKTSITVFTIEMFSKPRLYPFAN